MANLPITHMTLYKHGVGYFERKAQIEGELIEFSFRSNEMNDILKSLTVVDSGEGQVLGIDYATPRERTELLQGCSIRLNNGNSLQDLLSNLRGYRVKLQLSREEHVSGTLIGLDIPKERHPVSDTLVSILEDDTQQVQVLTFGSIQGIEILDERVKKDLNFFLDIEREQENHRNISIQLTPGEHNLLMSYVAPAPTWRVSYRIAMENGGDGSEPQALLLGWGIFDNLLEEDLDGVSLSLVAGMPMSFVYDLATPFTPERPLVKEEARVAAAPVVFEEAMAAGSADEEELDLDLAFDLDGAAEAPLEYGRNVENMKSSVAPSVKSKSMDELFKYDVQNPVTVKRGQSAMVPVISSCLEFKKDLLYNAAKMARHPVATVRMENNTGLAIERGPVTVLDNGEYVGEAVIPFTAEAGEIVVAYAVELGVNVYEESRLRTDVKALGVRGVSFFVDEWNINTREYRISNTTAKPVKVLIEHPRRGGCELSDTPDPVEKTDNYYRFEVAIEPKSENTLVVQERNLVRRKEMVNDLGSGAIANYFKKGLLDNENRERVLQVLSTLTQIGDLKSRLKSLEVEKKAVFKSQKQIQNNMALLSQAGDEGAMRKAYLQKLKTSEKKLDELEKRKEELLKALEQSKTEVETRLKQLEESMPIKKET